MTTLIERGAIALLRWDEPELQWRDLSDDARKPYLQGSRACLEAFRVPTNAMTSYGMLAGPETQTGKFPGTLTITTVITKGDAGRIWQAMIDAELETDT